VKHGGHHSAESKAKMSAVHKGKWVLPRPGRGIGDRLRGIPQSEEHRRKISRALTANNGMRGKHHSEEARRKIGVASAARVRGPETCRRMSEAKRGELHPNWRGGLAKREYTEDWTATLRRSIRERDRYTCRICGTQQQDVAVALDVHHVDYDKTHHDPLNLVTLCRHCHRRTGFNRSQWQAFFVLMLTPALPEQEQ